MRKNAAIFLKSRIYLFLNYILKVIQPVNKKWGE
jgi:hypothetical protein